MNITQTNMLPTEPTAQPTCTYWLGLPQDEKAFVVAYVENAYSVTEAADVLDMPVYVLRKMLAQPAVKKAISEIQEAMGDIDFLNEKWVKAQLLRIFPMVMGEEEVPMVTATGDQVMLKKFVPDVAVKILEYVTPKKAPTVQIDIHNQIDLRSAVAEGQQRRKARIMESIVVAVEEGEEENAA